jgi:hypothetical protein
VDIAPAETKLSGVGSVARRRSPAEKAQRMDCAFSQIVCDIRLYHQLFENRSRALSGPQSVPCRSYPIASNQHVTIYNLGASVRAFLETNA